MARKRFSPEQIITMLREAEVLLNQSNPVAEVCRNLGVSEQTYYRRYRSHSSFGYWPPAPEAYLGPHPKKLCQQKQELYEEGAVAWCRRA